MGYVPATRPSISPRSWRSFRILAAAAGWVLEGFGGRGRTREGRPFVTLLWRLADTSLACETVSMLIRLFVGCDGLTEYGRLSNITPLARILLFSRSTEHGISTAITTHFSLPIRNQPLLAIHGHAPLT